MLTICPIYAFVLHVSHSNALIDAYKADVVLTRQA